jgi:hypothetical protein
MLKLTRAELYDLVWSKPLNKIADEYSLNAIHLGQICDTYDVARPPMGYWQKLEHGKHVVKPPLSNAKFRSEEVPDLKNRRKLDR